MEVNCNDPEALEAINKSLKDKPRWWGRVKCIHCGIDIAKTFNSEYAANEWCATQLKAHSLHA